MTARLIDVTTRRPISTRPRSTGAWLTVLLLLLVLAAAVALHSPWLSLRTIEVVGSERVDAVRLLEQEGIGQGAIMIWLDTGRVERAITADPWAKVVRVERIFPDRLLVEIDERRAVAWVEGAGDWMLVAGDGTILQTAAEPEPGLLFVSAGFPTARPGTRPELTEWHEVVDFAAVLGRAVSPGSTLLSEQGELWLEAPGYRARLGHPIDLADKARVLRALAQEELPPGTTLDVVAPRRPAVVPGSPLLIPEVIPQEEVEGSATAESRPAVEVEGSGR